MRQIVLMTLALVWTLALQAQPEPLDSSAVLIAQVDVKANRLNEDIRSTAPSQTLSSGKFQQMGIATISEALKHLSGITVRDYGGAGGIKTVSVRGLGSKHTAVIYDGIQLNDCQTGDIDVSRYSIAGMERLRLTVMDDGEMLSPARNSAAATQLFIDPLVLPVSDNRLHMRTQVVTGAWGLIEPSVAIAKRISPTLQLSANADFIHADNDYPFTIHNVKLITHERRKNSRMNSGHGEAGLRWQINRATMLKTKVYYYDNNRQLPGIVRLYNNENDETQHDRNAFWMMSLRSKYAEKWSFLLNGKLNWAETRYHNEQYTGGIRDAHYIQHEHYASAAAMYQPNSWLSASYAADYIGSSLGASTRPTRHSLLNQLSGKVSLQRLTMVGRLLYSLHHDKERYPTSADNNKNSNTEQALSPSLSLSYRLLNNRALFLRAAWKQIFRMPTFNELYYYHIGSTSLSPEKTKQLNLGISMSTDIGKAWHIDMTGDVYLNNVDEKIVAIPLNMFLWRMMNVARVRSKGTDITFNVSWKLSEKHKLSLSENYTWQRVENMSTEGSPYYGHQLAYTPEHTNTTTLSWQNPWVSFSLTNSAMSHRWATNEHSNGTRIAGFGELAVSIYRTFPIRKGSLTAQVVINNILDKQYDIVAHYPMPGRSWRVSICLEM